MHPPDRSAVNVPVIGIPASLAIAYVCLLLLPGSQLRRDIYLTMLHRVGTVYMFCAVGVYV